MKKENDFSKGKRGAIDPIPPGKTRITIRLDNEIIDWFRNQVEERGEGNYQTMINNSLREYITNSRETIETTIRRVLQEEITTMVHNIFILHSSFETAVSEDIRTDIATKIQFFADTAGSPESQFCYPTLIR